MSRIALAMLGCGFATRLHSRTLRRFPDVDRFYASRDPARASEYADRYDGAGSFGSYEAALESPEIDVVLVATPPATHLALTRAALAAGKDVIVEKPPYLTVGELDAVADAAKEAGRRVLVAENYFYKPLLEELRRYVAEGAVGDVRIVTVNALKYQKTGDWRDRLEEAGAGALFEGGIHWISFMSNLGLTVLDAHGFRPGDRAAEESEPLERTMVSVFEYAEGAVGTLFYSWEIGSPMKGLRLSAIYGTAGTITFESNGLFVGVRGEKKRIAFPRPTDLLGYRAMFEDFFAALGSGRPARYELAAARRDLDLVERIYASAASDSAP